MNTATASRYHAGMHGAPTTPWAHRFLGVTAHAQTYRNIAYLLAGLLLGTAWFTVLTTAISVSVSLLVVALLGVPLLLATWYVVRAFANTERRIAGGLLHQELPAAPMASGHEGTVWSRLKAMTTERARWRELGWLLLRFPIGVATFTIAVTALAVPAAVAYAPIHARYADEPFGDWFWSNELERLAAGSPWSWLLVPLGLIALIGALHLLNALAGVCRRWTAAWLR